MVLTILNPCWNDDRIKSVALMQFLVKTVTDGARYNGTHQGRRWSMQVDRLVQEVEQCIDPVPIQLNRGPSSTTSPQGLYEISLWRLTGQVPSGVTRMDKDEG